MTETTATGPATPDIKPRSRQVTDGLEASAARGMLRAVGMGDEDFAKPQIGVASSWNEITPSNLSLDRLAQAACTPSLAAWASRSSDRLQGVISFQALATPIWGLAKSSSPIPTARGMLRAAEASRPSVTWRLRGLMSGVSGPEVMPGV